LLTITIVEQSSGAPSLLLTPATAASSVFTLNANVSASSQATRIEKMNFFYTVAELPTVSLAKGAKPATTRYSFRTTLRSLTCCLAE
jgi:hypothetical protein